MGNLLLNQHVRAQVKVGADVWLDLGHAFKSITQTLGENVYTASYLADQGFSSSTVTGLNYTVTFVGDYIADDPAISYFFSNEIIHGVGVLRKTQLRLIKGVDCVTWAVSLTKIQAAGGDANEPCGVVVEMKGIGLPTYSTVPLDD
jgi:hypothetical protein